MPLSLINEQLMRWINPKEDAHQLLQEFKGHSLPLRFKAVSFDVNNARNKEPVVYVENQPELAALF